MTAKILPIRKKKPTLLMTIGMIVGMPAFMVAAAVWAIITVVLILPFAVFFGACDAIDQYLQG